MKIAVLDRLSLGEDTPLDGLYELGEVVVYDSTSADEIKERVVGVDVLVFNKVKITADVLSASTNLKLLCVTATGYDNIDVAAAYQRGIAVCNVPGYSTDSVALYTIAMVTSLITRLAQYNRYVTDGSYTASGVPNCMAPVYHELSRLTWGIVGYGGIGRAVARIAEALGANVIVYKRTPTEDAKCVSIEQLCRQSDVITLHCPLNEESHHLINKDKIALMKQGVIIANLARGAVVNDVDIADAIKEGRIGGFAADVYAVEPLEEKSPLYEIMHLDNVLLTPHCAWGAYEARARCITVVCSNIKSFVDGKTLNRVDI